MRILIVEDDPQVRETLKTRLEEACFVVDATDNGERGSFLARTNDYDVVLLDYMLPGADGRQVCREIRESGKRPQIIMLSVKTESDFKAELLDLGADDYLTKPFSFQELHARIRAVLRRVGTIVADTLIHQDLIMNVSGQTVKRGSKEIYLTRKEFMLLEYLLRMKGRVVSRGMLLEHVWDSTANPFSNTIEAHVRNLRNKLNDRQTPKLIQTVPGRGYRISVASKQAA